MPTPPLPPHSYTAVQQAQFDAIEAAWAGQQPTGIVLGDSISAAAYYPLAQWSQLASLVANMGIGGTRVQNTVAQVQLTQIDLSQVTVAAVILGHNNLAASTGPGDDPGDLASWIVRDLSDAIHAKAPNAQVLVLKIPPYTPDNRVKCNNRMTQLAATTGKCKVVDPCIPVEACLDPAKFPDGHHPAAVVYEQNINPAFLSAL